MTAVIVALQEANTVAVAVTLAGIAVVAILAKVVFIIKDKLEVF